MIEGRKKKGASHRQGEKDATKSGNRPRLDEITNAYSNRTTTITEKVLRQGHVEERES